MKVLIVIVTLVLAQASAAAHRPVNLDVLRVQVMLDQAGFSPGVIDGRAGLTTKKALATFRKQGKHKRALPPVTHYRITPEDAAGPFVTIPSDMVQQASLPSLGYTSLVEAMAERFHSTPAFLRQLNPGARFVEGEEIAVPNVEPMVTRGLQSTPPVEHTGEERGPEMESDHEAGHAKTKVVVTVTKKESALTVTDASGRVVFYAPVTTGSRHDPLPIGSWKVNGVKFNPTFLYNPHLFWNADPTDAKAKLPAGPNNPVGLVWVDISKEHYGLHGTPEPSRIGRAESHGCVRLTNWDALKLADLVKPGTPVLFRK